MKDLAMKLGMMVVVGLYMGVHLGAPAWAFLLACLVIATA